LYVNPPLHEIDPADLMTAAQAAEWLQVTPETIRIWVHRDYLTHVDIGGGGPKLYHRLALADAEHKRWLNGADRPLRGGRKRDLDRARANVVRRAA
jgi:hypothetical protein